MCSVIISLLSLLSSYTRESKNKRIRVIMSLLIIFFFGKCTSLDSRSSLSVLANICNLKSNKQTRKKQNQELTRLIFCFTKQTCPIDWGWRIHWLHLFRGVTLPQTSVLDITINNLNAEVLVMPEFWGMQSSPSWSGVVAPVSVLSMGQIEPNWVLMLN